MATSFEPRQAESPLLDLRPGASQWSAPLMLWCAPVLLISGVLILSVLIAPPGLIFGTLGVMLILSARSRKATGLWPRKTVPTIVTGGVLVVSVCVGIFWWAWTENFAFSNSAGYVGLVLLALWTAGYLFLASRILGEVATQKAAGRLPRSLWSGPTSGS